MKQNYNNCLSRLLKDEGGYTNDPSDSGGPTNFGITLADDCLYLNKAATANDVRNMKLDDAKRIYKSKYWDALGCDDLSSGVDYTVFDYGVNSGLGRPRKALQRFKSLKGTELIDAINNERTAFLEAIGGGKNAKFEAGWQARVKRVNNYSKFLAANPPKDNTSGPVTGGFIATTFAAISQYWHQHQTLIIIGGLLSAVVIGTVIHMYKNKDK